MKNINHLKEGEKMRQKLLKKNEQTGFTIIEVVLVLAIAGLIFLIVFLALPQLQRSRRDSQRKSDAGRLVAAINNYQSNNNGNLPADAAGCDGVIDSYIEVDPTAPEFADPSEGPYSCSTTEPAGASTGIYYSTNEACPVGTAAGDRDYVVVVGLEEGGAYCQDNQ